MEENQVRRGTVFGLAAYLFWGLFPLYWKALKAVDATQILCNRIVWSCAFTAIALAASKGYKNVLVIFREPRRFFAAALCGALISVNWFVYIMAVNSGRIVETSIGYYLNPLFSAALGVVFLREKTDRFQLSAFGIAAIGLAYLLITYGKIPWISLTLALSFSLYGFVKKKANLDALGGLFVETAVVTPIGLAYILFAQAGGTGAYGRVGTVETLLLIGAGVVTAVPLFCYAAAAVRIPLTLLGFLQYLSPTLQLLIGIFLFGEAMDAQRAVSFVFILVALAIFSAGKLYGVRHRPLKAGKSQNERR